MPTAEINGIRLYYEVHGQGFPLVLLHGFAGTAQSWAPQIPALSARYRLILYDARGHWRSESPKDPRAYSQATAASDLSALLDHLGVQRAIVCGLSMGGVVAMTFYQKHHERVRALILADTGPGFKNPETREAWNRSREEVAVLLEREGIQAFADSPHALLDYYTPREVMLQLDPMGLAHTNRGVLAFHDSSLIDQLPSIAVPTLIIVGANDTDFVPAAAYMQRKISGSELMVLDEAGHGANVDQPEAFNRAVLDFLARRLAGLIEVPGRRAGATARIAEFVGESRWEDLPPEAVEQAKRAILDSVGVTLAGSVESPARIIQKVAEAEGGAPLCTVLGTGVRTGGVWAALANGIAGHALDFDDTNFAMMGHPSVPVLSAALAAGELTLANGRALLHAFLLGFEVETTLGLVVNPTQYTRGFHATGTLGTLGAVAAAAKLLGLDPAQTRHALALAASQAAGLKENFGTMTKPFHAGHAARSGLLAALLAQEGFTGSEIALEGPQGYLSVLGSQLEDPGAVLERLGLPWKILTSGVAVKPYPSCACTHSIIDAILELRKGLHPAQVARIAVGVAPMVPNILIHHDPRTGLEGKFSAEFCAAAAFVDGRVGIATFQDERTADPGIRALMGRVKTVVDPTIPGDLEHHMWTRVTLTLVDGRKLEVPPREVRGHPAVPLSREALRAKFMDCATVALTKDRAESVAEMLETLEGCPDLRSLTAILRP